MNFIKSIKAVNKGKRNSILEIKDKSDELIKRVRIIFSNGLELSVIHGLGTYGNEDGLYEIAIFKDGNFYTDIFDLGDYDGDQVLGYCDNKKVQYYINKIQNWK